MKILMVSSYLPYPLFSGGHIRLYNLISYLSQHHDITLICEKRPFQTQSDINEVEKICKKVITVERKKQWSIPNIISSGFSSSSFLVTGHTLSKMKQLIEEELKNTKYDLIHVETFYIMQNLPQTNVPILLVEHNIEYLVYDRFLKTAPLFLKPFLAIDIAKIKREETAFWKKATKCVAVSVDEKKIMEDEGVHADIVPNGVNINQFVMKDFNINFDKKEKTILYIGDFKWIQNQDAARWILKEIWPRLESGMKLKLWIVGKHIPDSLKQLGGENVVFDENAPSETAKIFQNSDILLSPKRVGGGTSYKILEAMATGTPVITTPLGLEGIDATDGKDILVAQTPEEFMQKIHAILEDKKTYLTFARHARHLIEQKYTWATIGKTLENIYNSTVER